MLHCANLIWRHTFPFLVGGIFFLPRLSLRSDHYCVSEHQTTRVPHTSFLTYSLLKYLCSQRKKWPLQQLERWIFPRNYQNCGQVTADLKTLPRVILQLPLPCLRRQPSPPSTSTRTLCAASFHLKTMTYFSPPLHTTLFSPLSLIYLIPCAGAKSPAARPQTETMPPTQFRKHSAF